MARLIDADALKDELELADFETDSRMFGGQTVLFEDSVFKIVDSAPAISPDEVRGVGHWVTEQEAIDAGDYSLRDTCSVCGRCDWDCTESDSFKYCPNCGARMEMEFHE